MAPGSPGIEDTRIRMVVDAYKAYFRKLAFEQLPMLAERYLGNAGFRLVADALAEATIAALPSLIEAAKGVVEIKESSDPLDVLELHYQCHSAAREITKDTEIGLFTPRRVSKDRLELVAEECPFNARGLQLAAFAGVVVGVLRALGASAEAAHSAEAARHIRASYAVYPEQLGERGCKLIVERRK